MSLSTKLDIRDKCIDQPAPIAKSYMGNNDEYWEVVCADKDGKVVLFRYSDQTVSLARFMLSNGMDHENAIVDFYRNGKKQ